SRLATGKILTFLVLILPITAAAKFSGASFSATTVRNRGIVTDYESLPASAKRDPSSPAPKPVELPLPTNANFPAQPATPAPATATATASTPPAPPPAPDYLTRTPDGRIIAEVLDLLYAA